ncbi:opioid growth factor receptor conserved region-domain-containing protein [Schizophyllum amplum]|uniref:Opioid growth factor receptor conserved region-domain-containing protein n=1 Tax=Schizophyllum amplum TaxID=97359 RepID=A0A550CGY0_9AGAR|nr:opioid growth factor receptor conserved region-domain-containing protein [Auriculariopsis ampla]
MNLCRLSKPAQIFTTRSLFNSSRMSLPRDVQEFLDGYPGESNDRAIKSNYEFYSNRRRCRPDNLLIDEMHDKWFGDYEKLEYKHGFIQWLFPIREHGMNFEAQPLQHHELEAMKADPQIKARLLKSYDLMLDFYGMRLLSEDTGLLDRAMPPRNYEARYRNLVSHSHNNLRISRILKCLSEFGLERLNAGFLLHVLNEQSESGELNTSMLHSSMDRWWANCIRNAAEREWVGKQIRQVRSGKGSFSRDMYEQALARRKETGTLDDSAKLVKDTA